MIYVNASQRLASATRVEAVTNAKGAIKFLKSEFSLAGLQVKKITQEGEGALSASFKGPFGAVAVGITLGKGGRVQFTFTDASGLIPKTKFKGADDKGLAVTLKQGKYGDEGMDKPIAALVKFQQGAEQYAHDLSDSVEWLGNFQDALSRIESQMDKGKVAKV